MAKRDRRGEDPADEPLDERLEDDAADDADDDEPVARGSGGTATKERRKTEAAGDKTKTGEKTARVNLFSRLVGRLSRFVREVVAELRKVIWPNRRELRNYALVVIAFVTVMLTLVGLLDFGFAKGVLWVFGNGGD